MHPLGLGPHGDGPMRRFIPTGILGARRTTVLRRLEAMGRIVVEDAAALKAASVARAYTPKELDRLDQSRRRPYLGQAGQEGSPWRNSSVSMRRRPIFRRSSTGRPRVRKS